MFKRTWFLTLEGNMPLILKKQLIHRFCDRLNWLW